MSSRNVNLSEEVRSEARVIYEGMETARQYFEDCKYEERSVQGSSVQSLKSEKLRSIIEEIYTSNSFVDEIHYISVASKQTMQEVDSVDFFDGGIVSVAVTMGGVRLIDNMLL